MKSNATEHFLIRNLYTTWLLYTLLHGFLRIWSRLLKESLMENLIFGALILLINLFQTHYSLFFLFKI